MSKSGNTFYLVIDRNAKGENTVHFMNLVDEADLLSLMEDEDAEAYTAEKEAAAQAEQERKQTEEDAKKAAEEAAASGSEQTGGNKVTKYAATFLGVLALVGLAAGGGIYTFMKQKQKKQAEKEALDPDANYKVGVSGVCQYQKTVWHPAKTYAPPGCGQRDLCYGCRIVRLGDSRERKKRPHLVKKLNHKSIKEGIQMKQNRIFDQNSSQKARSWHYNMDTNRAEAQFADGSAIAIDCLAIEDEYGNTPAQRAELDWLLYNKPLECVQLVLSGEIEHYLSLGCDHGKLKD